jgi:hypothetical protein
MQVPASNETDMRALAKLAPIAWIFVAALLQPLSAQTPQLKVRGSQPPQCDQMESIGPSFVPLAKLCRFVNSPSTLPNFICTQKTQSFKHKLGSKYQYAFDTFTAEMAFDHGKQTYANVAINGRPKTFLQEPHTYAELHSYFVSNPHEQRNIALFAHFAEELATVFDPLNHTTFQYKGGVNIDGANLEVFSLQIRKRSLNKGECDKELHEHLLGIELMWGGTSTWTGARGLIWIDKATSVIRRIVLHYTEFDHDFPIVAFSTSTNYGLTRIADLGDFVLPVEGEDLACDREKYCWRTLTSFSNCRKFAAQARIVPDTEKVVPQQEPVSK